MYPLTNKALSRLQNLIGMPEFSDSRYCVRHKIGQGGMGSVYLAEDTRLQRQVALKVMDVSESVDDLAKRMRREAQVIARLEHPGIVPIHDVGVLSDGRLYYAMKLVQGDRLDVYRQKLAETLFRASDALPDLLRIFQKICEAVAFAHSQQIIHRDLKPENIMVGAYGEVLVMDWGLAKILHENDDSPLPAAGVSEGNGPAESLLPGRATTEGQATGHGTVMGTPAYMAPEQASGDVARIDRCTDVFALGAILSFLLTGDPGAPRAATAKPGTRKIPRQLVSICRKASALEQERRYPTALELARDIERYLNGLAVSAHRENIFEMSWRWLVRYKFLIFIVLIYMVVRVFLFFLLQGD